MGDASVHPLKGRYTANDLPLKILTFYVANVRNFPDKNNKEKFTKSLLAMLKRPPSVWPIIRLLFPSVRTSPL